MLIVTSLAALLANIWLATVLVAQSKLGQISLHVPCVYGICPSQLIAGLQLPDVTSIILPPQNVLPPNPGPGAMLPEHLLQAWMSPSSIPQSTAPALPRPRQSPVIVDKTPSLCLETGRREVPIKEPAPNETEAMTSKVFKHFTTMKFGRVLESLLTLMLKHYSPKPFHVLFLLIICGVLCSWKIVMRYSSFLVSSIKRRRSRSSSVLEPHVDTSGFAVQIKDSTAVALDIKDPADKILTVPTSEHLMTYALHKELTKERDSLSSQVDHVTASLISAQDRITLFEQKQVESEQLKELLLAEKDQRIQSASLFSCNLEKDLGKLQQQRNALEQERDGLLQQEVLHQQLLRDDFPRDLFGDAQDKGTKDKSSKTRLQGSLDTCQRKLDLARTSKQVLNNLLNATGARLTTAESKLAHAKTKLEIALNDKSILDDRLENTEDRLARFQSRLDNKDRVIQAIEKDLRVLRSSHISNLRAIAQEKTISAMAVQEKVDLKAKSEVLEAKSEVFKARSDNLEVKSDRLSAENARLEASLCNIKQELAEKNEKLDEDRQKQLCETTEQLEQTLATQADTYGLIQDLTTQLEHANNQLANRSSVDVDSVIQDLKAQLEYSNAQLTDQTSLHADIQRLNGELDHERQNTSSHVELHRIILLEKDQDLVKHQQDLNAAYQKFTKLEQQAIQAEDDSALLNMGLQEKVGQLEASSKQQAAEYQSKLDNLTYQMNFLRACQENERAESAKKLRGAQQSIMALSVPSIASISNAAVSAPSQMDNTFVSNIVIPQSSSLIFGNSAATLSAVDNSVAAGSNSFAAGNDPFFGVNNLFCAGNTPFFAGYNSSAANGPVQESSDALMGDAVKIPIFNVPTPRQELGVNNTTAKDDPPRLEDTQMTDTSPLPAPHPPNTAPPADRKIRRLPRRHQRPLERFHTEDQESSQPTPGQDVTSLDQNSNADADTELRDLQDFLRNDRLTEDLSGPVDEDATDPAKMYGSSSKSPAPKAKVPRPQEDSNAFNRPPNPPASNVSSSSLNSDKIVNAEVGEEPAQDPQQGPWRTRAALDRLMDDAERGIYRAPSSPYSDISSLNQDEIATAVWLGDPLPQPRGTEPRSSEPGTPGTNRWSANSNQGNFGPPPTRSDRIEDDLDTADDEDAEGEEEEGTEEATQRLLNNARRSGFEF